jgi:3-hydroxyisobutyrate dehydrogenase-like beta-hydroxyacid dehydrogenase
MSTPVKSTGMIGLGAMGYHQMACHMKNKGFEGMTVAIKPIHLEMR